MSTGLSHFRSITPAKCQECGKEFFPWDHTKMMYCSRECVGRAHGKQGEKRERGALNHYICAWCQKPFSVYHKNRRFCSVACTASANKGQRHGNSGRRDANHSEIVSLFEKEGFQVVDCSRWGLSGFPDIMICLSYVMRLVEIKNPNTKYGRAGLNKEQVGFSSTWQCGVDVASTEADVKKISQKLKQWNYAIQDDALADRMSP